MSLLKQITVAHIVATANDNVIGCKGGIPWHSKKDMQFFKKATLGFPVIMGKATYESLPVVLEGRVLFILTRNKSWLPSRKKADGVFVCHSVNEAVERAKEWAAINGKKMVWIAGGGEIYRETLPMVDMVMRTKVHVDIFGDTHYPELNEMEWCDKLPPEHVKDGYVDLTFECLTRV